jgi:hypothetical protein
MTVQDLLSANGPGPEYAASAAVAGKRLKRSGGRLAFSRSGRHDRRESMVSLYESLLIARQRRNSSNRSKALSIACQLETDGGAMIKREYTGAYATSRTASKRTAGVTTCSSGSIRDLPS